MTKPLSPAAQAVLDAFAASENGVYLEGDPERLAAALQALVNNHGVKTKGGAVILNGDYILAIATEMEGLND